MKIVFTGGHHNAALAVISALKQKCQISNLPAGKAGAKCQIFWMGHKYSMWRDKSVSAEYTEVTSLDIPFYNLKAGKFYGVYNPIILLRIPLGFIQAVYYLIKIKPDLIVSFGGYLAVPVVLAGFLLKIPSITHEQTVVSGLANKLVAKFSKKVMVSWEYSKKYFPMDKVILTGLPLRKEIFKKYGRIRFKNNLPTIYITGGKQGSHIINRVVGESLKELLLISNVIHQSGSSTLYDDYEKLLGLKTKLSSNQAKNYVLKKYITSKEIGSVFQSCDLVVGRSGAHTSYELSALGKPALLIPIPKTSHNEQYENAKLVRSMGNAEILLQKDLTKRTFLKTVKSMVNNLEKYKGIKSKVILNSDKIVADEILKTYFETRKEQKKSE